MTYQNLFEKSRVLSIPARLGLVLALLMVLVGAAPLPAARAATITVNTTDDELNSDGDCSLREAIQAANTDAAVDACPAGSGADTITFAATTNWIPIVLAGTAGEDANASGDLDILDGGDLTIQGNGAANTIIDGGGIDRVFHVCPAGGCANTVTFSGVTIQNGSVTLSGGGGIRNEAGTTIVDASVVSANAALNGGGISNFAALIIQNGSTIGGAGAGNTTMWGNGGGIYNYAGTLTVDHSTVSANTAANNGGGIWSQATLNVQNGSTIGGAGAGAGNTADNDGGGIYNYDGGATIVDGSDVISNTASNNGGGIYNRATLNVQNGSSIGGAGAGNTATGGVGGGVGGGIYNYDGGTTTVDGSIVSANTADYGGGIYNRATLNVQNGSSIGGAGAGNQAFEGGGIYNWAGTTTVDHSTVSANTATGGVGGGISAVYNSTLTIDGVVIQDNIAHSNPPLVFGRGGGVYVDDSTLTLSNSTVASNTAYSGGGAYLYAGDNAILNDNFFTNNDAIAYGGGVYVQNSQAVAFTANLFTGNSVVGNGGGSYILFSDDVTLNANTIISNADTGVSLYGCEDVLMDNNVIADNEGGVSITGHTTRLRHNTIARNGALGISVWGYWDGDGTAILTDTILVSHTVGITVTAGNTATLEGTLWGDGAWTNDTDWGGAGHITTGAINMHGIPAFVDPDGGDYHIGPGSAAIDAGVDAGVLTDIDGDLRPLGSGYDIGADEAQRWIFLPLVLK